MTPPYATWLPAVVAVAVETSRMEGGGERNGEGEKGEGNDASN